VIEAILDTDIGSDVDDALALCLALVSPEIELLGITTVYGQTQVRARIARALTHVAGRRDIPVFAGLELPLLRERPAHWMGHEGVGIDLSQVDLAPEAGSAVDFVVRTIRQRPGRVSIIAIGPLTNVAAAVIVAPDIVELARELIFIGGVARLAHNRLNVPALEWNVRCDPEAARVVFRSGMKITMLGMDVTRREETHMDQAHLHALRDSPSPLARMAARLVEIYWGTIGDDLRYMHDVVAVAFSYDRSLVLTEPLDVVIETTGTHMQGFTLVTRGESEGNVHVGTGLDGDRIRSLFISRVCAPLATR
jgi:purine nucleosidase